MPSGAFSRHTTMDTFRRSARVRWPPAGGTTVGIHPIGARNFDVRGAAGFFFWCEFRRFFLVRKWRQLVKILIHASQAEAPESCNKSPPSEA